jgi:hypothetical protein
VNGIDANGLEVANFNIPENKNRFFLDGKALHPIFPIASGEVVTMEFALPEGPIDTVRVDSRNPFYYFWNLQPDTLENILDMDLTTIRQALPDIEVELEQGGKRQPLPIAAVRSTFQGLSPELAAAQAADPAKGWRLGIPGIDSIVFLQLATPLTPAKGAKLIVKLKFHGTEAPYPNSLSNNFRVAVANNPHGLDDWLALFKNQDRTDWMKDAYLASKANAAGKSPLTGLDLARAHYLKNYTDNCVTRVMVMEERPTPVETYVLARGAYDHPIKERPRERTTPKAFPPLPKDAPKNRLGLAQWSMAPENPLPPAWR